MMGQKRVRIEHAGAVVKLTHEAAMRNFVDSIQIKPILLAETIAVHRSDIPRIGEFWKEQGGVFGGIGRGVNGQPDHFMIVHPELYIEKIKWGGEGEDEPGAKDEFDGLANTLALCNSKHDHPAAQWCRERTGYGFADFYLPARRECSVLYGNVPELFAKKWHWTSTQYSAHLAWVQYFDDGHQHYYSKDYEFAVRPVRRFAPSIIY